MDSYKQAELALASYASLSNVTLNTRTGIDALKAAGMSDAQATAFALKWSVVDQFNSISGVSATVFQENATGQKYLAVRGTEGVTDFIADYFILTFIPFQVNLQYPSLKLQVQTWLANGAGHHWW